MRFQSFDEMIRYRVEKAPQSPAFRTARGGAVSEITYAEFHGAVGRRAEELRDSGKTSLAVFCDGSYECVTEVFAAVRAGLQVALLNDAAEEDQLRRVDADLLWGDEELIEEFSSALTGGAADGAGRILFFTSGTTAKNKAVELTEGSLCASAYNGGALLPLEESDILMCMLPLDHVFGFVCGLLWGLSCGACVALGRGQRHYFDDLKFFKPTALSAVPMLLGFLWQKQLLNRELRLILIGAGDCPPQLPAALKAQGLRVSFGYGLTETSSGVALSLGDDPYAMTVCPDARVTIAEDGEILIEDPPCMMRGYYKDPDATAAVLRGGVLFTGDLGRYDRDGLLHITGRKKEMLVMPDGTKIFLPEYEQTLCAALNGRDYAVIGSGGAPVLVVSGRDDEAEAVRAALLPVMRELPLNRRLKAIHFINDPLPRTATGKIKRWELQQKAGLK